MLTTVYSAPDQTYSVFGLHLSPLRESDLFQFVADRIKDREPCYLVTPNLHFARLASGDPAFCSVLNQAALRLCDSAILSAILKLRRQALPARLTGSGLTPKLLEFAERNRHRVFLFGSDEGTLAQVRDKYPGAVCGFACPPRHEKPWEMEEANREYVAQIKESAPDLLFIALGARKQEFWADRYHAECNVPVTMCIGASLDFIAQRVKRAPVVMQRIGLEWLWRVCVEPNRLWQRYLGDGVFLLRRFLPELLRRRA